MSKTRQRIIECAYELFGRSGFHAVGLEQIIGEVGVSKQTFYNHFESKDELILAVLRFRRENESQMFERMLSEIGGRDPKNRLYSLFDALLHWFSLPDWKGCIFMRAAAEFPSHHDPAHIAARDHADATREYLQYQATLAGASDPAKLASQLAILIEGVVACHHLTRDDKVLRTARMMSHQLLDQQFAVPGMDGDKPRHILPGLVPGESLNSTSPSPPGS